MKNILLVVDMQNGFAQKEHTKELVNNIKKLLEREIFDVVIGTRFLNSDNSMYEKLFGWSKLKMEHEIAIPDELEKHMDYIEDKYIYNCVNPSFMQRLCQLNDGEVPQNIFIIGVDTDCCVLAAATSLFENNIRPIVLTQYCNSNGGTESHLAGIRCLERLIGEKQLVEKEILSVEDLNEILQMIYE